MSNIDTDPTELTVEETEALLKTLFRSQDVVGRLIAELWGLLTPDLGPKAWEEAILKLAGNRRSPIEQHNPQKEKAI